MSQQYMLVRYAELSSPQQETYNFHKIAARLADNGFNCIPLNDDWLGADFLASHVDGNTFLKVQQKGRFEINKKYAGKDLHIAFRHGDDVYVYPHDLMMSALVEWGAARGHLVDTVSWAAGGFSWKNPTKEHMKLLAPYRFTGP
ncbi:hypothetical protein [Variovorax sp.]|jgi:hypothetical protein|uniref:hypothetical protein n=1 Tax=Variovorax sp. TaxID=1871043 RepID=UPI000C541F10|nr:hypothetical protein [Variovorax sp.]MBS75446.1 hypothetical protein [Variovorax sp.]